MDVSFLFENALFAPLMAFLAVVVLVPVVKVFAPALGLMDQPDSRKVHVGAVPLIGGLVVFPVFIVLSLVLGTGVSDWPLYAALAVLLITGAVDDRVELLSWTKFGMQFLAAFLIVVPGGAQIYQLGDVFGFGDLGLGYISVPFSIVAVVLLINAINLMDGLDGLAGGIVLVMLGWMAYACMGSGSVHGIEIALLMGGLAGFLFYNMRSPWRRRAMVFMGDAGSMCLGLMVAWFAIKLSPEGARIIEPMSVAWVFAVPIWDECAQFYRRVKEGRHPFSADRGHFHHHFIRAGFSDGWAVWSILVIVFVTGAIGVLGHQFGVPMIVLSVSWIVLILAHMAFSRDLDRYTRLIGRLKALGQKV
jgi:UDP-GlcNAc:undecaprenyl-phosphate GlcNAc-1-phosphate transferase